MTSAEQLKALDTYFNLMSMNGGARIYHIARQLGVFDALAKGPSTSKALADACGLKEKPTTLLLDVLHALHILDRQDAAYSLSPVMKFLSGNYSDLSDKYWDHLPKLLKTGIPLAKMDDVGQSEKQYQAQVTALAWMMRPAAEIAATMLDVGGKRKNLNMLDVGAGSAVWSLTFVQKDNRAKVTAVDWPAVLQIASASAQRLGLQGRFATIPGNYHEVEFPPTTYDLAIVGNVTHIETPDGNKTLFTKVRKALKPQGEIVIFDILPRQEAGDLARTLYALGLALRTEHGQVYSCDELRDFLVQTGFKDPVFSPMQVPPYTMGMILARKG